MTAQTGWGVVLQDAQAALRDTKARARKLRRSITAIEEKIAKGEPLPEYLSGNSEADEDRRVFERASRRYLQMSADEFVEKWNGGFFTKHPEIAYKAVEVALLLPFLRPNAIAAKRDDET